MGESLFIADLHLHESRPETTRLFLDFLQRESASAEALYILGDLFEIWFGDDDPDPGKQQIVTALKAWQAPLFFMHGNRDFLIGAQFLTETGAQLLQDPTLIELYGKQTLLMHGDTLCTDDQDYQAFRNMVRAPALIEQVLSLEIGPRIEMISEVRAKSRAEMSEKSLAIMDANQQEIEQVMRSHQVQQLIHGHTHRPAIHDLELDGQSVQRMVVGDWHQRGSVLRCTPEGCSLEPIEA
ncbi:UDP-2,3-diacylglucosamine diphosphatase [Solemya pervernicosa gill symbiont]|uniref:UDP-2,3-diacylglucosamine hydrolase n=2 Tax=Gammaproteobacteria incertae sedis TaxID=118884 RepID=A0A1T2L6V2_9GAMM|nr:UDP-2,3-diacylglucosamine diphosphatase [Candidatus Reidiella endopervernicosa]OOZ40829.1 UDP-2,3-diacylglucosamine diphosphatase [Solemya pervernicosa gill symbiont]QKQ26340.1 UDP-2,3-diacylglucosamine diphosphatase [Candidatus Reidiella endopervernicosa]